MFLSLRFQVPKPMSGKRSDRVSRGEDVESAVRGIWASREAARAANGKNEMGNFTFILHAVRRALVC